MRICRQTFPQRSIPRAQGNNTLSSLSIRRQISLEARVSNAVIIGISILSDILFTAFFLKN